MTPLTDKEIDKYRAELSAWIAAGRPSHWPVSESEGTMMREVERWLATIDVKQMLDIESIIARCRRTLNADTITVAELRRVAGQPIEQSEEGRAMKIRDGEFATELVEQAVDFALAACKDCGCARLSHFVSDAVLECRCGERPCSGEFKSIFAQPIASLSTEPPIECVLPHCCKQYVANSVDAAHTPSNPRSHSPYCCLYRGCHKVCSHVCYSGPPQNSPARAA